MVLASADSLSSLRSGSVVKIWEHILSCQLMWAEPGEAGNGATHRPHRYESEDCGEEESLLRPPMYEWELLCVS